MNSSAGSSEMRGWILDLLPESGGMGVWVATEEGARRKLFVPFISRFCVGGEPDRVEKVRKGLSGSGFRITSAWTTGRDLMSGALKEVLEIDVSDPLDFPGTVARLIRQEPELSYYNCDIPAAQMFLYSRELFPLAFCAFSVDKSGEVGEIRCLDSPWDTDFRMPDIRTLFLRLEGGPGLPPRHGPPARLEVASEGEVRVLDGEDPASLLHGLNRLLRLADPDLILSDWGDDWILPGLWALSRKTGIPLLLDRSPGVLHVHRRGASHRAYGRTHFRPGACLLNGRWHIDRQNSVMMKDIGLEGLIEQSRVTQIPLQRMARTSTGSGITSMQISRALREGILVPWRKSQPEEFRSGADLLSVDKGGMVFLPPPGFHESVAELDFSSMYPSIMTRFNISPETVGCPCCPENRVPGTAHHLCRRRTGLVPAVLGPILEKRQAYKRLLSAVPDPLKDAHVYNRRQIALKWLLVVSFGYLGYRNARFGRVEAHECVTAYGREILLAAKEIAEERGFRLLHGIVDSLWIEKAGITEEECRELASEIGRKTGIEMKLEGLCRWILFFPSRSRPGLGVPNRFLGVFRSGEIKVRGLELRRSDTAPLVCRVQEAMITILAGAGNWQEYQARIPQATEIFEEAMRALADGHVPLRDLVLKRRLSRAPEAYGRATVSSVVARELAGRGLRIEAGETLHYILTGGGERDPADRARAYPLSTPGDGYDGRAYQALLERAADPLLHPEKGR